MPVNNIKNLQILLGIAAGMVVLFFIFKSEVFLAIAVGLCLAGLLSMRLAALIAVLWMKVANLIGLILNTVLLSLVFFGLLTPLALIRKIAGISPILLRPTQRDSYFHARNHKFDKSDLQDMW
jgi:polyferredoxin